MTGLLERARGLIDEGWDFLSDETRERVRAAAQVLIGAMRDDAIPVDPAWVRRLQRSRRARDEFRAAVLDSDSPLFGAAWQIISNYADI